MENGNEQQMMDEEYGRDFGGCLCAAVISAIVIVTAIVILFT